MAAPAGHRSRRSCARLRPVLPAVVALGVPVSIDTMKAEVADWALGRAPRIVNDVWGLQRDPDMARVVAEHGVPVVIMHNRDKADPRSTSSPTSTRSSTARSTSPHGRHRARRDRARSRHRLRQDAGAEHDAHRQARRVQAASACRSWSAPRASASSHSVSPSEPTDRLGGSIAAHLIAVENGAAIIRDPRRRRNRPGAARRRRPPERAPMTRPTRSSSPGWRSTPITA